jgi:hypothetical protein
MAGAKFDIPLIHVDMRMVWAYFVVTGIEKSPAGIDRHQGGIQKHFAV